MKNYIIQKLVEYTNLLKRQDDFYGYDDVCELIIVFLENAFSESLKNEFKDHAVLSNHSESVFRFVESKSWNTARHKAVGFLESLIAKEYSKFDDEKAIISKNNLVKHSSKSVFIVHGRNNEIKETVARYIERIGLETIILHEKPNNSRTIIEKIEKHSDVGFAIILLTPDDVGSLKSESGNLNNRARQNVILELGYFFAKLGRERVCAIRYGQIEFPSDFGGILFIDYDEAGAWRTELAKELKSTEMEIKTDNII